MDKDFTGRKAMGAIGSPVVLISSSHNGSRGIMTINMIAGLSFNPPLIGVSLSNHSHTASVINESREFAINIISGDEIDLAKRIGASTGRKIDKFAEFGIDTFEGKEIAGPLVKGAHTVLECMVSEIVDIGNHSLYIAEVVAYHEFEKAGPLYLYHGKYYSIGEQLGSF